MPNMVNFQKDIKRYLPVTEHEALVTMVLTHIFDMGGYDRLFCLLSLGAVYRL